GRKGAAPVGRREGRFPAPSSAKRATAANGAGGTSGIVQKRKNSCGQRIEIGARRQCGLLSFAAQWRGLDWGNVEESSRHDGGRDGDIRARLVFRALRLSLVSGSLQRRIQRPGAADEGPNSLPICDCQILPGKGGGI